MLSCWPAEHGQERGRRRSPLPHRRRSRSCLPSPHTNRTSKQSTDRERKQEGILTSYGPPNWSVPCMDFSVDMQNPNPTANRTEKRGGRSVGEPGRSIDPKHARGGSIRLSLRLTSDAVTQEEAEAWDTELHVVVHGCDEQPRAGVARGRARLQPGRWGWRGGPWARLAVTSSCGWGHIARRSWGGRGQ